MYAKIIKWFSYALMAAVLAITVICVVNGMSVKDAEGVESPTKWTSVFLYMAYAMAIIPILCIVVLGAILGSKNNPKGLLTLLLFGLVFVGVIFVAYLMAPGTPVAIARGTDATAFSFKMADTALYVTYIVLGGVIAALLAGGVYRLIKG